MLAALRARAWSGSGSTNVPLTRWPVPTEVGSATLSSASPAVEMTFAVVEARYVLVMPGVNAPNVRRRAERQRQRGRDGAAGRRRRGGLQREVGVVDVEEHVADRLDLDAGRGAVTCGNVTSAEPSFGVLATSVVG